MDVARSETCLNPLWNLELRFEQWLLRSKFLFCGLGLCTVFLVLLLAPNIYCAEK